MGREHRLPRRLLDRRAAVLASHRAFQAGKWTNGGHWQNIKNANDPSIGIGVWRYGSRTRLMTDFCR